MRIATYNINGIRARFETVMAWLELQEPHVALLQEIKIVDEAFPREVFTYVRPEDLTVELAAAGFESVRIDRPEGVAWVFAIATTKRLAR